MSVQENKNDANSSYDYKETTVSQEMESMYAVSYQNFGWELVSSSIPFIGATTVMLKFRRTVDIRNKAELNILEKQFENGLSEIKKIESRKRARIILPSLGMGFMGVAFLVLAILNFMADSIPLGTVFLFPAIAGMVLGSIFSYRLNKTINEQTSTQISKRYDEIHATCEEARVLASEIVHLHKELEIALEAAETANHNLEEKVEAKTQEVNMMHTKMLDTLATIIEYRSLESGLHIQRTMELTKILVGAMLEKPKYRSQLIELNHGSIVRAVPLHDVGKVGIPDNILLKPGKLSADEFEVMKTHTTLGGDIIGKVSEDIKDEKQYLKHGRDIALYHHERWDGSGYCAGLKGEEIPLSARIVAVVDVYDALVNKRCYKDSYSYEETIKIINDGRGTQFDPDIVNVFLEVTDEFEKITNELGDLEK